MARHCSKCGKVGHYAKTCGTKVQTPTVTAPLPKEEVNVPIGHQILQEQNKKVDRIEDDTGQVPEKDLWIINKVQKKIYGKIMYVKRSGEVVWQDVFGASVETEQEKLIRSGCTFVVLEPTMLQWKVVNL